MPAWFEAAIFAALFFLLAWRMLLSVEMTDEAHGVASIYNIYQGKVPFMTSWDYHTGWCLLVPLFWLYHRFVPGLEGVLLYFRAAYLIFTMACVALAGSFLRKYLAGRGAWHFMLPAVFYIPASIFQISYNSFSAYLLLLVAVMVFTSEDGARERARYFACGALMCLCSIAYPTMAVFAIVLLGWIAWANRNGFYREKAFWYALGGGVAASIFLAWVFCNGSLPLFLDALEGMLSSPHQLSKGKIDAAFLHTTFIVPVKAYVKRRFTAVLAGYVAAWLAARKVYSAGFLDRKGYVRVGMGLAVAFLLLNGFCNRGIFGYAVLGALFGFFVAALFLRPELLKKYAVFFLALAGYLLTYALTSDNRNVFVGLEQAGPMAYFVIGTIAAIELLGSFRKLAVGISLSLALSGLLNVCTYIYRDSPVQELTAQVESGIYKGLYTTLERKVLVEEMERELEANIEPGDTLCVVTRAPMVYLMAKAEICAPQTWDAQFLARGYTSAEPLLSYFEAVGQEPDVLAATSLDLEDFYGNGKYEIHGYIEENYSLCYESAISGVKLWIWRKEKEGGEIR